MITYRVRPGDTFSSLAAAFYGSASRFTDLADANDLADPGMPDVGQELRARARCMRCGRRVR